MVLNRRSERGNSEIRRSTFGYHRASSFLARSRTGQSPKSGKWPWEGLLRTAPLSISLKTIRFLKVRCPLRGTQNKKNADRTCDNFYQTMLPARIKVLTLNCPFSAEEENICQNYYIRVADSGIYRGKWVQKTLPFREKNKIKK